MKQRNVFLWICLMAVFTAFAQENNKLDVRSRVLIPLVNASETSLNVMKAANPKTSHQAKSGIGGKEYDVILSLTRSVSAEELQVMGLKKVVMIGHQALGLASDSVMARLSMCGFVKSISLSGSGHLHNDLARKDSRVDDVHNGLGNLPTSYRGDGVVVGIYDMGFDFNHINFLSHDLRNYRIKRVWKYETTGNNSYTETCYDSSEAIKALVTDDSIYTHATHTLGILAGAFSVHNDTLDVDYSGMAPDADILVGCGPIQYSYVLRAINNFQQYADSVGKPLVVNLSLGDDLGPHDGTDTYASAFNTLGAKTPIVISAGNEGASRIALIKTFNDNDRQVRTVVKPNKSMHQYLDVSYEAVSELQVWSEDTSRVDVEIGLWSIDDSSWVCQVPVPQDYTASYVGNGDFQSYSSLQNDDFDELFQNSVMGYGTGIDNANNRYTADIYYLLRWNMENIDHHVVPVIIAKGKPGKRVYVYCDGTYNELTDGNIQGWDNGSGDGSISNIACGENVISVGSYCTRKITEESTLGEVSPFSSWGTLVDGRRLPDVVAPGDCIVSSMSTPFTASNAWLQTVYPAVWGMMYGDQPNYWTVQQGTSQAAPAVAGIIALWLQANPSLTPSQIKEILKTTAAPLPTMTAQCGAGKVDALAGMEQVINSTDIKSVSHAGQAPITVSQRGKVFTFVNEGEGDMSVSVFNLAGQKVWQWQGHSSYIIFDGGRLPNGIYIVKASAKGLSYNKKITL